MGLVQNSQSKSTDTAIRVGKYGSCQRACMISLLITINHQNQIQTILLSSEILLTCHDWFLTMRPRRQKN